MTAVDLDTVETSGESSDGRRRWRMPHPADIVSLAVIVAAFALPLRGLLRYQGPPMEEGFMLVFPQEVLRGQIPNRDFLHLYGPGSLWVLAAYYKLVGVSLAAERFFGLLQHAGIVFGVWAVARHWGRRTATVCALVSLLIVLPPIGLTALAWNGGVALALWAVLTAARPGDPSTRRLVTAGVLGGCALLYRPDLLVAVGLGLGAAVWPLSSRRWRPVLAGLTAGFSPILIHLVTAGPRAVFEGMFVEPVFRLRPGRSLPVPPSWNELDGFLQKAAGLRTLGWSLPAPTSAQQVAIWFYLVPLSALFVAAVGIWSVRRRPDDRRGHLLRAVGLFGLGMLTQSLQRPDTAHFAWVSCVPLALVPVAVHQILPKGWGPGSWRRFAVTSLPVVLVIGGLIPHYTIRTYVDLSGQTFGRNVFGYPVHHDGRNFYYGSPEAAAAANELVADLGRLSKPGERLLVGPVDFRFTPYSDAFFYFLFPDLVPATRYIEMDPGIANAPDSGLADEVASADWLILSNVWTNWAEPNASLDAGSDAPNKVVQEKFCKVGAYGNRDGAPWFELYRRCTKPSATARSTLGLALTASGDWAILVDGLSGNPASTRVTAGGREFRVPGVPLIDPYLFWHNGNLIVAGFDCPNLDTETLGGDTAADCGTLAQTVLRLDLEAEKLTVVARSIPTDEFAPGPLVGDTLLLDNGATLVHLSDGSVTKGRALPASVARCGSGGGLVELLPTSKDSPGSMEPITRIRATEADAGTDVTAGLPWGQGGIEGVAGCTADGVAVYVTTDDVAVYELTRRGDAIRSRRLGGPGLGPDWNIQVAGDRRTLVATKQQGESTERRVWTGDRWLPVPNTGRNPGQVTVTESAVISVSGDEAVATISEVPK